MPEWLKDAGIVVALLYVAGQVIASYNQRKSKEKQDAEVLIDLTASAKNLVEGGDVAVETAMSLLAIYEGRIKELETGRTDRLKMIEDQGKQITELQSQNEDLQAGQIATQRQIEALNRNYAAEISRLKHQWREWYDTLRGWLNEKGLTGYPEPPSGLLDTGEHKVGGEK